MFWQNTTLLSQLSGSLINITVLTLMLVCGEVWWHGPLPGVVLWPLTVLTPLLEGIHSVLPFPVSAPAQLPSLPSSLFPSSLLNPSLFFSLRKEGIIYVTWFIKPRSGFYFLFASESPELRSTESCHLSMGQLNLWQPKPRVSRAARTPCSMLRLLCVAFPILSFSLVPCPLWGSFQSFPLSSAVPHPAGIN